VVGCPPRGRRRLVAPLRRPPGNDVLAAWVLDARARSLELTADLDEAQLMGPRLANVNPLRWELGHVAWFQERWACREAGGEAPLRADGDALYDSMAVAHDARWGLPLPTPAETVAYAESVRDRVLERLAGPELEPDAAYYVMLGVFHEDMHTEAFTSTRQTLGYPAPRLGLPAARPGTDAGLAAPEPPAGDAEVAVPDDTLLLGADPDDGRFCFDNEKWAHPVAVRPFRIARGLVTQRDLAAFTADDGYRRRELWDAEGWAWRSAEGAELPWAWRPAPGGGYERRVFDRWLALAERLPAVHVNHHEARAYCRWAGRRLPTEAEWEAAATVAGGRKRTFPWGDEPPGPERARLDWTGLGPAPVGAHPAGASPAGVHDLIGQVWEWTADAFRPYPGFTPDPYDAYSAPWFETRRVLRGGAWPTRGRLLRGTWRSYYEPERRDVWAGFRTCAIDDA